jgi:hypothetical protein
VTVLTDGLAPAPGERGRVSADLSGALEATVLAWDALLDAVEDVDLLAETRKPGRTAARTLVVLGSWPEGRPLASIRRDALAGTLDAEPLTEIEGRVVDAHVADAVGEIIESLRRARDDVASWAASDHVHEEALLPVGGPLGIVPLGTLVAATAYQCAVAARDLRPAGARVGDALTALGLEALIDTVGAVAAQQGATLSLAAITPQIRIATGAGDSAWRTTGTFDASGPALTCDAGLLLDIAASRVSAPAAYARGELRAQDLPGLLTVAQVLARSPGLPGTDGLYAALKAYEASTAVARAVGDAVGSTWRRLRGN